MIIKRNVISLLFLTILLTGCEWYRPPNEPLDADAVLRKNIVGTWRTSKSFKIIYYSNGLFVDSLFFYSQVDTNQCFLYHSFQGKYSILNNILQYTNIHCTFLDTTILTGMSRVPMRQEIQISDNRLICRSIELLTSSQPNDSDLWGTWIDITWVYHYVKGPPLIIYEGRERKSYTFFKDSTYFYYGQECLDGNPWPNPSWKVKYSYTPPILNFWEDSIRVEFKYGNKMYWYYNKYIVEYYRDFP